MKTSRTISTISFNTPDYLKVVLNELIQSKTISFWAFISHKKEEDEKKDHCHVFIEPAHMLQTVELKSKFNEFDPENPSIPRSCISFTFSKFDDWYLYVIHDRRYLALKGESRKFHYTHDDLVTSDDDDLFYRVQNIDLLSVSRFGDIVDAIETGVSKYEYFARGTIPLQQVNQFITAWDLIVGGKTYRDGRVSHVDTDTGEVVE